jgi:hypothetical protein
MVITRICVTLVTGSITHLHQHYTNRRSSLDEEPLFERLSFFRNDLNKCVLLSVLLNCRENYATPCVCYRAAFAPMRVH